MRATTAVLAKDAINCARKITVFKKYEKNCARNLATRLATLTLFSIILQSEPLMLKHVWGKMEAQNMAKIGPKTIHESRLRPLILSWILVKVPCYQPYFAQGVALLDYNCNNP